jgi:hypothetical protein
VWFFKAFLLLALQEGDLLLLFLYLPFELGDFTPVSRHCLLSRAGLGFDLFSGQALDFFF